ncbi:MAG: hypothetical protein ACOX2S_03035 [bacterium]
MPSATPWPDWARIEQDRSRRPLKIGLIGEIYVVLEPFANHNVQTLLEEMGVLADRSVYLAEWSRGNAVVAGRKRRINGPPGPFSAS